MSLAQHVSGIEGVDRLEVPDLNDTDSVSDSIHGPTKVIRRVLSYDAFPPENLEDQADHQAAYKVRTARRALQVVITVLACWLASGIVFGFAALKPVLISEGVYRELCTEDELQHGVELCIGQDIRLNLFFTIASITTNVSALPVGTILDRYGPRVCGILGSIFLLAGSILMFYAFNIPEFDGYLLGNFFLALGGTFIFVPSFHISNAFPKYSGTIVALITGSFDASAAVFLFYRMVYEATNHTFTPNQFFLAYAIVPILIFIAQVTLLPGQSYSTVPELEQKVLKHCDPARDIHSSDSELSDDEEIDRIRFERADRRKRKIRKLDRLLGGEDERHARLEKEEERLHMSAVWGVLHGLPAYKQMLTPWFVLMTLLTVLQMLRMNYFIATIRSQYQYMLSSPLLAEAINKFFNIALPVGGVVATPFIGVFLDNLSTASVLAVIVSLTTIIGMLNSLPFLWAGYATVVLFCLLRPLYYSAMSDYATKVFGFRTFGRVYGTIICLSGMVNFSQVAIDSLTLSSFGGNPLPVNVSLTAAGFVVGIVLVFFMWRKGKVDPEDIKRARARAGSILSTASSTWGTVSSVGNGYGAYGSIGREAERRPLLGTRALTAVPEREEEEAEV